MTVASIPSIREDYDNRQVSMVYALQNIPNGPIVSTSLTAVPVLIVRKNGQVTAVEGAEPGTISAIGLPATHRNGTDFRQAPPYVLVSRNEGGGISVERFEMNDEHLNLFPAQHRGTGARIPSYVN